MCIYYCDSVLNNGEPAWFPVEKQSRKQHPTRRWARSPQFELLVKLLRTPGEHDRDRPNENNKRRNRGERRTNGISAETIDCVASTPLHPKTLESKLPKHVCDDENYLYSQMLFKSCYRAERAWRYNRLQYGYERADGVMTSITRLQILDLCTAATCDNNGKKSNDSAIDYRLLWTPDEILTNWLIAPQSVTDSKLLHAGLRSRSPAKLWCVGNRTVIYFRYNIVYRLIYNLVCNSFNGLVK